MTNQSQNKSDSSADPQVTRNLIQRGRIAFKLMGDRRVPTLLKGLPILALAYLISPVDLIPEFLLPVLGPLILLDDVSLLILALNTFIKYSPPQVVAEVQQQITGVKPEDVWQVDEDDAAGSGGPTVEGTYTTVDDN